MEELIFTTEAPIYNSETHIVVEDIIDGKPMYAVVEKPLQDRINDKIAAARINQEQALLAYQKTAILNEVQSLDDETALENQSLYPMWADFIGKSVKVGEKYQDVFNNDIALFRVVQEHTVQEGWNPESTPALWVRVGFDNEILEWVQPTGAHDAYNIGDKVLFDGEIWESTVDGNVYAPKVVEGQWIRVD